MRKWLKIGGVAVAATALMIGTSLVTAGFAERGKSSVAQPAAPPGYQPDFEAKYVPITPCRIVDTRAGTGTGGTPIGNLQTRTYYVGGTFGFAPQGGKAGGCGIPVGVVSITATLTAATPAHAGFVRAWPNGQTEPSATVLNYSTVNISAGTAVTINPSSAYSLKIRNYNGPTDLIIDVTGYYVKPLAGMISADGDPYSGSSRVLAASKTGIGVYEVEFDRNIRYCSATATVYVSGYYASASTWFDSARQDTVQVKLFNPGGSLVDQFFYIQVAC